MGFKGGNMGCARLKSDFTIGFCFWFGSCFARRNAGTSGVVFEFLVSYAGSSSQAASTGGRTNWSAVNANGKSGNSGTAVGSLQWKEKEKENVSRPTNNCDCPKYPGSLKFVPRLEVRAYTMAKDRAHAIVTALVTHPKAVPWKIEVDVVHNQTLNPIHYHPIIYVSLTTQYITINQGLWDFEV